MIGKRTAIWKREEYSYESEERDIPYVISRKAISSHEHFIGPDTMRLYLHTV